MAIVEGEKAEGAGTSGRRGNPYKCRIGELTGMWERPDGVLGMYAGSWGWKGWRPCSEGPLSGGAEFPPARLHPELTKPCAEMQRAGDVPT